MSVLELTSVEAKLTEAVKADLIEVVGSLGTVGIEVEDPLAADELVSSEGFDGFDCFLDFHGFFFLTLLLSLHNFAPLSTPWGHFENCLLWAVPREAALVLAAQTPRVRSH